MQAKEVHFGQWFLLSACMVYLINSFTYKYKVTKSVKLEGGR